MVIDDKIFGLEVFVISKEVQVYIVFFFIFLFLYVFEQNVFVIKYRFYYVNYGVCNKLSF